jgi:hypothetical protein
MTTAVEEGIITIPRDYATSANITRFMDDYPPELAAKEVKFLSSDLTIF